MTVLFDLGTGGGVIGKSDDSVEERMSESEELVSGDDWVPGKKRSSSIICVYFVVRGVKSKKGCLPQMHLQVSLRV